MNFVSTKDLRQKFPSIKKALEQGESFLLLYRSAPIAEIRPFLSNPKNDRTTNAKLKTIDKIAGTFTYNNAPKDLNIDTVINDAYEKSLH